MIRRFKNKILFLIRVLLPVMCELWNGTHVLSQRRGTVEDRRWTLSFILSQLLMNLQQKQSVESYRTLDQESRNHTEVILRTFIRYPKLLSLKTSLRNTMSSL